MTEVEADRRYGSIVFRTQKTVVRAIQHHRFTDVVVHKVVNGEEQTPRGYVMGSNMLRYEP